MPNNMDNSNTGGTRRSFLEAGAVVVGSVTAARAAETLALNGGPKAVTIPATRLAELTRYPRFGDEEKKAMVELLGNGNFYQEIPLFEKELKEHLKAPYVKAHANGTSALMSMFFALDLPRGSEIMAPSYTAWATTAPMHLFGYVPRFVDINPRTMTFDLADAAKRLTPRTRALLPMHSFGNPCDMDQICAFAKERGLVVVEDAAQAQGASLQGQTGGHLGLHRRIQHAGLQDPARDRRRLGSLPDARILRARHRVRQLRAGPDVPRRQPLSRLPGDRHGSQAAHTPAGGGHRAAAVARDGRAQRYGGCERPKAHRSAGPPAGHRGALLPARRQARLLGLAPVVPRRRQGRLARKTRS